MTIYAGLRDAILATMDNGAEWYLPHLIAAVAMTPIVTTNDGREWGGQSNLSHRVRSELAKLKRQGLVEHLRRSTYQVA